jgi:hypothetical protein
VVDKEDEVWSVEASAGLDGDASYERWGERISAQNCSTFLVQDAHAGNYERELGRSPCLIRLMHTER